MNDTRLTSLPPEGFRRTPWKNGGGITIDIADAYRAGVNPGDWTGMIWRFGRTAITTPGPFSDLTGYERLQLVIVGSGLVLESPAGEIDLRKPFQPVRYDGGTKIVSRLENGPVEVVNLIADRALCNIELIVADADGRTALLPGTHLIYAPETVVSATSDGIAPILIESGSALRLDTGTAGSLVIETGRAIVATIRPREASA